MDTHASQQRAVKAISIIARQPHTACLVELLVPRLDQVPSGRRVPLKVLQVGTDGTDKELYLAHIGVPPEVFQRFGLRFKPPFGKPCGVLLE